MIPPSRFAPQRHSDRNNLVEPGRLCLLQFPTVCLLEKMMCDAAPPALRGRRLQLAQAALECMQVAQLVALEHLVGCVLPGKIKQTASALQALYNEEIVVEVLSPARCTSSCRSLSPHSRI